ncbi:hypothetical protein T484DRAFT_1942685 [Baffinella frigidus]|nr:hypothetical protein T484DRAFT_1942685 [Cryptophyta sp. CCMP2293]|mmetsp:Transcript_45016/g.106058  ORF Transcript_45016/g.106058 Transcript_45016/m.106058 type:complete len:253 (-) Transcript_45016:86-844(-)
MGASLPQGHQGISRRSVPEEAQTFGIRRRAAKQGQEHRRRGEGDIVAEGGGAYTACRPGRVGCGALRERGCGAIVGGDGEGGAGGARDCSVRAGCVVRVGLWQEAGDLRGRPQQPPSGAARPGPATRAQSFERGEEAAAGRGSMPGGSISVAGCRGKPQQGLLVVQGFQCNCVDEAVCDGEVCAVEGGGGGRFEQNCREAAREGDVPGPRHPPLRPRPPSGCHHCHSVAWTGWWCQEAVGDLEQPWFHRARS